MEPDQQSLYDPKWVSEFYNNYGEIEWQRMVKTPCAEVQFEIHKHYIKKHVQAGNRVLEIGPGPGRFTQVFVEMGCRVLAADISPVQLALNKQKAEEHGFAHGIEDWLELDICDLTSLDNNDFDVVVAYGGPLSYVFDKRDLAVEQMKSKVKSGGVMLLSVMGIWGTVHTYLSGVLDIDPQTNQQITEHGDLHNSSYPFATHFCHMYRAQELRELLENHQLNVIDMSASHCLTSVWGDQLNAIRQDNTTWQEVLRMEIEASREPGCLDMGTHIIAVAYRA